jgi:hypothetical protein
MLRTCLAPLCRLPRGLQLATCGLLACLAGETANLLLPAVGLEAVAAYPLLGNTICRQATVAGLFAAASGMLHWSVLGIRLRGPRPGLLLLTGLCSWFFLGHLLYLLGSYQTLFHTERFRFASGMAMYKSALIAKIAICAALPLMASMTALLARRQGRTATAQAHSTLLLRLPNLLVVPMTALRTRLGRRSS